MGLFTTLSQQFTEGLRFLETVFKLSFKLLTQNRLINGQNLAFFHELKNGSGTWLSPPRLFLA